ncbi:hypothetical protein AVEN_54013-1 [Araneus ventricosus]|uniref:Uncharacterized protein n=1 Tax=Araneus ventricosus TaxID=182803 RepID=A0A4Y2VNR0_ARAVE|nr:hypothetical protein AVEN_54013-1 [Araneus ventricosus]
MNSFNRLMYPLDEIHSNDSTLDLKIKYASFRCVHSHELLLLTFTRNKLAEEMTTPELKAFSFLQFAKCKSVTEIQSASRIQFDCDAPSDSKFSNGFRDYQFWTILRRKGVSGNESYERISGVLC